MGTSEIESNEPVPGGIYSVTDSQGGYRIVKVLVFQNPVVHVRIYKGRHATRPSTVDPASLALGAISSTGDFGIGHAPMTVRAFLNWEPHLICQTPVDEDELDGYRIWLGDA